MLSLDHGRQKSFHEKRRSLNAARTYHERRSILAVLVTPFPLAKLLGWPGLAIYILIMIAAFCIALKVETIKKQNDIQTYKEISSFMEGKSLDDIEKQREDANRPYQKTLLAICSGALSLAIFVIMAIIFG